MGLRQHKPRSKCARKLAVICHCLVPESELFWVCCGYYCTSCGGQRNQDVHSRLKPSDKPGPLPPPYRRPGW